MLIDRENEEIIHKMQLSITKIVFDLCEQRGIRCFLVGGSLLGAVKEKRILSGDKDVDIGMLREDYEKFRTVAEELPDDLIFLEARTNPTYNWLFAKVYQKGTRLIPKKEPLFGPVSGVYVDVVPYDFVSENEKERKVEHRRAKIKKWFMLLKERPRKFNWKLTLLFILGKTQDRNKLIQYFVCNQRKSEIVQNIVGGTEKDWFTLSEVMDFQTVSLGDRFFRSPRYKRYLDLNYPDWQAKDTSRTELYNYTFEYE